MNSAARGRVDGEAAFVLHTYPFRETSLIVEAFSRDHGLSLIHISEPTRPY